MQTTLTIATVIATASALNLSADASAEDAKDFLQFLASQGKSYANLKEFNARKAAFFVTDKWQKWANKQPGELAHYAHNFMSDLTDEEKQGMMGITAEIREALNLKSASDEPSSPIDKSSSDDEESGAVAGESGSDDIQDESSAVQVKQNGPVSPISDDSDDECPNSGKNKNNDKKKKEKKDKKNRDKKKKDKKKKDPVVAPDSDDDDGPVCPDDSDVSEESEESDDSDLCPVDSDDSSDSSDSDDDIPDASTGIDWRDYGAVGPVKNQGSCGSCWAFAANSQLESMYQIQTGELLDLSEQNLVDCATDGNNGCNGGFMYYVYAYYSNQKGLMETSDYPYTGKQGNCQWSESKAAPFKTANTDVKQEWKNSDWKTQLQIAPISIALSAGNEYFSQYSSGILNTDKCTAQADHAVNMIGWGVDSVSEVEYWIVRNSWSTGWGEDGYIRIATTGSGPGVCGVQGLGVTVEIA